MADRGYAELVEALRFAWEQPCYCCTLGEKCNWGDFCFFKIAADAIEELLAKDTNVPDKWEREMPTESGWYWVVIESVAGKREMFPAYFDAEYFEMQSIEGGIACELVGVTHVMPMRFPAPPKGVE